MSDSDLIQTILKLSKHIRFVTIIDHKGRLLESKHKEGITSVLTKKESKKSINQIHDFWKKNKPFVKKFGKEKYAVFVYDNITRMVIYQNKKNILYITADPKFSHTKTIPKIMKLVSP